MNLLHHAYSATAKRKLLFAAAREGGPWQLVGNFDPREDVLSQVSAAKQPDNVVEIVVTDEAADRVLERITRVSKAYHAAGLGPKRAMPERLIQEQKEREEAESGTNPKPEPQTGSERARRARDRRRARRKSLKASSGVGQSPLGVPGAGDLVAWEDKQHANTGQPADHGAPADGGSASTPETSPSPQQVHIDTVQVPLTIPFI